MRIRIPRGLWALGLGLALTGCASTHDDVVSADSPGATAYRTSSNALGAGDALGMEWGRQILAASAESSPSTAVSGVSED